MKAKIDELAREKNMTVSQFLANLINDYVEKHGKTEIGVERGEVGKQVTVEKLGERAEAAICPLCDAPLVYVEGDLMSEDKIECSNLVCDTRKKEYALHKWMGEKEYLRLLNLRRREAREKARREEAKTEVEDWEK